MPDRAAPSTSSSEAPAPGDAGGPPKAVAASALETLSAQFRGAWNEEIVALIDKYDSGLSGWAGDAFASFCTRCARALTGHLGDAQAQTVTERALIDGMSDVPNHRQLTRPVIVRDLVGAVRSAVAEVCAGRKQVAATCRQQDVGAEGSDAGTEEETDQARLRALQVKELLALSSRLHDTMLHEAALRGQVLVARYYEVNLTRRRRRDDDLVSFIDTDIDSIRQGFVGRAGTLCTCGRGQSMLLLDEPAPDATGGPQPPR